MHVEVKRLADLILATWVGSGPTDPQAQDSDLYGSLVGRVLALKPGGFAIQGSSIVFFQALSALLFLPLSTVGVISTVYMCHPGNDCFNHKK